MRNSFQLGGKYPYSFPEENRSAQGGGRVWAGNTRATSVLRSHRESWKGAESWSLSASTESSMKKQGVWLRGNLERGLGHLAAPLKPWRGKVKKTGSLSTWSNQNCDVIIAVMSTSKRPHVPHPHQATSMGLYRLFLTIGL